MCRWLLCLILGFLVVGCQLEQPPAPNAATETPPLILQLENISTQKTYTDDEIAIALNLTDSSGQIQCSDQYFEVVPENQNLIDQISYQIRQGRCWAILNPRLHAYGDSQIVVTVEHPSGLTAAQQFSLQIMQRLSTYNSSFSISQSTILIGEDYLVELNLRDVNNYDYDSTRETHSIQFVSGHADLTLTTPQRTSPSQYRLSVKAQTPLNLVTLIPLIDNTLWSSKTLWMTALPALSGFNQIHLAQGWSNTLTSPTLSWQYLGDLSYLQNFEVAVGSSQSNTDIFAWTNIGLSLQTNVNLNAVTECTQDYFYKIRARFTNNLISDEWSSSPFRFDLTAPVIDSPQSSGEGSAHSSPLFSWLTIENCLVDKTEFKITSLTGNQDLVPWTTIVNTQAYQHQQPNLYTANHLYQLSLRLTDIGGNQTIYHFPSWSFQNAGLPTNLQSSLTYWYDLSDGIKNLGQVVNALTHIDHDDTLVIVYRLGNQSKLYLEFSTKQFFLRDWLIIKAKAWRSGNQARLDQLLFFDRTLNTQEQEQLKILLSN